MDNKYSFNSKKYMILLGVICLVFTVAIIKAFEYLPEKEDRNLRVNVENINNPSNISTTSEEEQDSSVKEEDQSVSKEKSGTLLAKSDNDMDFETIDAPNGINEENTENINNDDSELTQAEKAELAIFYGQKYLREKKYTKSLTEFQKVENLVEEKELLAMSYEGIAQLYAINRKYGSAMTYATKAFNLSPSSSREMLLAKLYYKTGDIDKSTKRINNVLHRGFEE